jgi:CRP/FNR family transcriptional regulator, cyclic AMP receptor protein
MPVRSASRRLWALLDEPERAVLVAAGRVYDHPRGTELLHEGAPSGSAFVLLRGRVKVLAQGAGGLPRILAIRVPGDVIGELAAIDGGTRSATVVAIDPVRVLRVPADRFNEVLRTHPAIAHALLVVLIGRLRMANHWRVEYGDTTVAERVATVLAQLAAEHGRVADRGIAIALPFRQEDLAGMVAGSREAVVRALRDLREKGVISTGRRRIVIHEPEILGLFTGRR